MKLIACNRTRSGELEMNRRNQMGRYWADSHWVGRRNRTESDVVGGNRAGSIGTGSGGITWHRVADPDGLDLADSEALDLEDRVAEVSEAEADGRCTTRGTF